MSKTFTERMNALLEACKPNDSDDAIILQFTKPIHQFLGIEPQTALTVGDIREAANLSAELDEMKKNNRYQRGYHDGEQSILQMSVTELVSRMPNVAEYIAQCERQIEQLKQAGHDKDYEIDRRLEQVDSMHKAIAILRASDKPAHLTTEEFQKNIIRDAKAELQDNI